MNMNRHWKVWVLVAVSLLCLAAVAQAQENATPGSRLSWDQNDSDADQLEYWLSVDGAAPAQMVNVSCDLAVSPPACLGDLPAMTPGAHSLTLIARRLVGGTPTDSLPSMPLDIVMLALPSTPGNLQVQ